MIFSKYRIQDIDVNHSKGEGFFMEHSIGHDNDLWVNNGWF